MIAAPPPPCTLAAARAAIVQTRVRAKLLGDSVTAIDPKSADRVLCPDARTIAVTIASGGTAGDIGFVVFRESEAGWTVALVRAGYKLGLFHAGADLISSQPVYEQNDPNCCPTGGFDHVRYRWNGRRYAVVRRWRTARFKP
jgi:hypothetical protein